MCACSLCRGTLLIGNTGLCLQLRSRKLEPQTPPSTLFVAIHLWGAPGHPRASRRLDDLCTQSQINKALIAGEQAFLHRGLLLGTQPSCVPTVISPLTSPHLLITLPLTPLLCTSPCLAVCCGTRRKESACSVKSKCCACCCQGLQGIWPLLLRFFLLCCFHHRSPYCQTSSSFLTLSLSFSLFLITVWGEFVDTSHLERF